MESIDETSNILQLTFGSPFNANENPPTRQIKKQRRRSYEDSREELFLVDQEEEDDDFRIEEDDESSKCLPLRESTNKIFAEIKRGGNTNRTGVVEFN